MKKIWVIIIAALTLANIYMTREQAAALSQVAQLRTEKEQLTGEIAVLENELHKLEASHTFYISVSDNLSNRVAVLEGWNSP